ncbi:vitamin K epoxide reductase family protein [Pedobacter sp. BG31]|uniref:vitamin K epoxide reductase family protein n=1 Tax=Pedobacter sp. BG31 TaxID=3349697 RepID=UPI0035F27F58
MLKIYKNLLGPQDNTLLVIHNLLKTLKVTVTKTDLRKKLEQHPLYPSLLCVSDVLNYYKVENLTIRLKVEKLKNLEQPFVALLKAGDLYNDYYCLIKSTSEHSVIIHNSLSGKETRYDWTYFEKIYRGIVLIAESSEKSGEKNFKKEQFIERKERLITDSLLLFSPILTLVVGFYNFYTVGFEQNIIPFIYNLLSLVGAIVASLLFYFEVDRSNTLLLKVCGGKINNSLNCNQVLNSKASSFLSVSWSIWGVTFFLTVLFGQILNGFSNRDTLQYLSLFSMIATFYIPFSIYYQWKVVRQWCKLCLIVQLILFSQSSLIILSNSFADKPIFPVTNLSWNVLAIFVLIGLLIFLLANQMIRILKTSSSNKVELKNCMKVKFNPLVFDTMLKTQKSITITTEGLGILLGNQNSKNKIVKVCNPYCEPCAKIHPILNNLLEKIDDLSIQILFTASNEDNDLRNKPVKHFLAIYETNKVLTKDCLDDWYTTPGKNYDHFAAKYQVNEHLNRQSEKIDEMNDWCKKMNIDFTPTIFFNGYQLPESYSITDIEHFLKS